MAAREVIVVDASVWIDFIRDRDTPQTRILEQARTRTQIAVADLTITEVLQGTSSDKRFAAALAILGSFPLVTVGGREIAVAAARNFRRLRSLGITVRGTIDTLIATRCIEDGHALLFADRDFEPFVTRLGLIDAGAAFQH